MARENFQQLHRFKRSIGPLPKWDGLTATVDGVLRRRSRTFTLAVATLAAPTYTLTRPTALEWLAAHQATARLGDVSEFSCRL